MHARRRPRRALAAVQLATSLLFLAPGPWPAARSSAAAEALTSRFGTLAWLARLGHNDPAVRRGALYLLGRFAPPQPRVTEEIVRAVDRETDRSVLLAAVGALATARHPNSLRELMTFFGPGQRAATLPTEVHVAAVRALAGTSEPQLGARLLQISPIAPAELVDAAAETFARLPDAQFATIATAHVAGRPRASGPVAMVLRGIGRRGDPRWSASVIQQLRVDFPIVLTAAIEAAERLHLIEATGDLTERARAGSGPGMRGVRRRALAALGRLGGPLDPVVFREAIADASVRDVALAAVAELGDRSYVDDVTPLLAAAWSVDRRAAADVLAALGGPRAVSALRAALATERDPDVRSALWHALARLEPSDSSRAMRDAIASEPAARWAAVERALRGGDALDGGAALGALLARREPGALVLAGVSGGHERALLGALGAADAAVRGDAALGLAWSRGRSSAAVDALIARLSIEDDEGVRAALVLALGSAGGDAARGALITVLERERDAPSTAAVVAALQAGRLGAREALPVLRAMLRSERAIVRSVAAVALGELADPAASSALQGVARFDPEAEPRGAAVAALARVSGVDAVDDVLLARGTAFTARLAGVCDWALEVARGTRSPAAFSGASLTRMSGAEPRSVWAVVLPDGGLALGVASSDGQVLISGAPSSDAPLVRVDGP